MAETPIPERRVDRWRLARLLRPHLIWLIAVVVLLGLLALANMALPFCLKVLVDDVFPGSKGPGRWDLLGYILTGLAIIYVLRNILFFTTRMIAVRIGADVCFLLRSRLFEHLQQMSLSFYKANQIGKLSSRLMDDTHKLLLFVQDKLPTMVLNLLMLVILLAIMYLVDWKLAIVSTLVLPFHFLTYRYFMKPIKQSHAQAQQSVAAVHGSLVERFLGMEVVKSFAAERQEHAHFKRVIADTRYSDVAAKRYHFAQKVAADLLIGVGMVSLLGFGAWHVIERVMTTGEFFMFFGYVMMLYPAVLEVLSGSSHLTSAGVSVDRVFEVLEERRTDVGVLESDPTQPCREVRGEIEFQNVHFAYDDETEVLCGLSFKIQPGEHVAVTGPSGAF